MGEKRKAIMKYCPGCTGKFARLRRESGMCAECTHNGPTPAGQMAATIRTLKEHDAERDLSIPELAGGPDEDDELPQAPRPTVKGRRNLPADEASIPGWASVHIDNAIRADIMYVTGQGYDRATGERVAVKVKVSALDEAEAALEVAWMAR